MNADGSGLARLGDVRGSSPTWSPDGTRIAFLMSGERAEDASRIAVMDADGSDVTPISEPGWWGGSPDWSPDGASILATLDRGLTDGDLLTTTPDGDEVSVIERLPVLGRASWSPDGHQITYVSKGQVWVMDADGSNARRITALDGNIENPTWG
jgi:TolB protein